MTDGERVAVVLAAGKGTRMRSQVPKVLHHAAGRPLLAWVLDAARAAGCRRILVVVGHGAEEVRAEIGGGDLTWVVQADQRGTGHALAQVEGLIGGPARLLVLSGDVPLVRPATLERLLAAATAGWGAMAVADLPQPGRLGRVVARAAATTTGGGGGGGGGGAAGEVLERIVEAADATPAELALRSVNAGLYALPAPAVFSYLAALAPANAQQELYLTDALTAAAAAGRRIELVRLAEPREAQGVNDRQELAAVHRCLLDRHLETLMDSGVTVLEPARTVVEASACVGVDTVLHPGVSLLGLTSVGTGCVLQQGVWVRDGRIGDRVTIGPYSVIDGAEVGSGCQVGPFARLTPASTLLSGARVGGAAAHREGEAAAAGSEPGGP
jgi:bifunctional UDP-N-acetylglucosamine pyrophosphorylase/glucosamine-1-phosphate N-acetyltransferase